MVSLASRYGDFVHNGLIYLSDMILILAELSLILSDLILIMFELILCLVCRMLNKALP